MFAGKHEKLASFDMLHLSFVPYSIANTILVKKYETKMAEYIHKSIINMSSIKGKYIGYG